MHDEDSRIKRRVREAHAAAGSPPYADVAARINAVNPEVKATKAQVDHWLAQGAGSVVIPARVLPALAGVFGVSVAKLLGIEESEVSRIIREIQGKHEARIRELEDATERLNAAIQGAHRELDPVDEVDRAEMRAALLRLAGRLEGPPNPDAR